MKRRTIVYANFTPYENTGRILDYLLDNFETTLLFSFNFHKMTREENQSKLIVFRKGKAVYECTLHQIPITPSLLFTLLPVRSFFISAQIIFHLLRLRKKFGPFDTFFTVNAFTAYIGNILRKFGIVKRTVIWVWDYYPPIHANKIIMLMRWIYWQFDKKITNCNRVVFLNERLQQLRKDIGVLPKSARYPVVPIGTDPEKRNKTKKKQVTLGFVGVLKKSQGLDLVYDSHNKLSGFKSLKLVVIGGGPEETHYKKRSQRTKISTEFYGYIGNENEIKKILSRCTIGVAPYVPEESNVSYYGDPSKIKVYLSLGLPVITTDVFHFSSTIQKKNAGIIIDYFDKEAIVKAIKEINARYDWYSRNALNLAREYEYTKIYSKMFNS